MAHSRPHPEEPPVPRFPAFRQVGIPPFEAFEHVSAAFRVFLSLYLVAYQNLSERERFVLQMVEVKGMRYREAAEQMGVRLENLKMIVCRARKKLLRTIEALLEVPS